MPAEADAGAAPAALHGVRVLDLTRLLPGGYCTMLLGDLGAEVLKVEEVREGDYSRWQEPFVRGASHYHLALHRNKESVRLNLKDPRGRRIFLALVRDADVLLEGFRPGVADRLGIGWQAVNAVNPRLVYASLSGFGAGGAFRDRAAHDLNYLALGGVLSLMEPVEGRPALPGIFIADMAGGLTAAFAILAALRARDLTGRGQRIDVALHDVVVSMLSIFAGRFFADDTAVAPRDFTGARAAYNVYRTADGGAVTLAAFEERFWRNFCRAVGRPDLEPFHFAAGGDQSEAIAEVSRIFAGRTRSEWEELLGTADCCFAPVLSVAEVAAHPHVLARRMVFEAPHPVGGMIRQLGHPARLLATPATYRKPAPAFGEHTAAVLARLGYEPGEIAELERAGVVGLQADWTAERGGR